MPEAATTAISVAIQQTSLPRYRLPVFQRLATTSGIHLHLHYAEEPALPNVAPDGFEGHFEPFQSLPKVGGQAFFWHATQWQLATPKKADVVIMNWNVRYLSLLPALLRARASGVPVALWGHGFSKNASRVRSWLRQLPARLATAVLVYDANTAAQLVRDGLPAQKVFVAANGLDSEAIQTHRQQALATGNRAAWRHSLGLGEGPVLIFLGRLFAQNRLDLVIAALPALTKQFPELRLAIIGKGAEEQVRLEALAAEIGVTQHLQWVGPIYDEAKLAPWLISADLFVYPSNVGLSLIHAFNYALPAVVCAPLSAHNPEVVALRDNHTGAVAPSLDVETLADTIAAVLADESTLQSLGETALQSVLQTYNLNSMVAGFNNLIQYLHSQRRTS